MLSFSNVYITLRVRASLQKVVQAPQHKKFWDLVLKLKDGQFEIPGLNVEKLYSKSGKLFSARMSREMRLIFSMRREGSNNSLIIHELNHHDQAYDRLARTELSATNLQDANELLRENSSKANESGQVLECNIESEPALAPAQLFKVPHYLLADPGKYIQFEKSLDRYLDLSEEQEEILALRERTLLVQGPAGTGKTTLALFWALNLYEEHMDDAVYLFTYHDELACVCRAYKVNLVGEEEDERDETNESGIKVFSYIDFCRRHLRQVLKKKDGERQWISRKQSIDILKQIISAKPRWARAFSAEDLYGLIYSILKGRFMPGTESLPASKEDYEHIFKDYGRMPEGFEDTLEVFAQYQARLERSGYLDEADIIRLSYDFLKQNAFLAAAGRRLWIVIDEVQDFTELEWKSILLFWENHCKQHQGSPSFPFLCGDINQNISRSGFRWQELESYLQSILRKLHRPNSLKKVTLHQNYRNTLQIHQLAAFMRKFASDTGDLGLAPELEGDRPRLVIASDQELLSFLQEKESRGESVNPLVVLVENDDSLSFLRKELANSQSVFLLSLRSAKGMEFEDVIIHRAFSSSATISALGSGAEASRLFDLWYMGITRACKNLLLVQNRDDYQRLGELLQERDGEFFQLVEVIEPAFEGLAQFWNKRELDTPNYNVIFLERKMAQDLWDIFLKEQASAASNEPISDYGEQCRQRALALWRRCLDYSSLGRALKFLENFEEAAIYLMRAALLQEAAVSMEATSQYSDAALQYEKLGLTTDAARCYEYGQDYLRAAQLHEEEGNWLLAAQNYHSSGDLGKAAQSCEKAGMYRSAADIYRMEGKYQQSAELYVKVDDNLSAAEMYLRIKDKLDAARCFQKSGRLEKAIALYDALKLWDEAADAAHEAAVQAKGVREAAMHARAAHLYLKAGRLSESARSFAAAQLFEKSADLYAKVKDYNRAAESYQLAGLLPQAALMYEQAGDWRKALKLASGGVNELLEAKCREKLGQFQDAAQLYEKCGAISEAAYCLEKANDYSAAADLHLKGNNMAQAANCLSKIDRRMDAARLYVVSGHISSAYELVISTNQSAAKTKGEESFKALLAWCLETRKTAAAAQLLELKKDYLAASDKFRECLMLSRAAECLEKSGRLREAGILHRQSGDMERAAACFKQSRQWQEAGNCLEQMKKWAEAKNMYQRCHDEDGVARCNNALNWF